MSTEAAASDKLVLYSFSSPARKISILLEELGVAYENKDVALFKGEHFEPWFKEISPRSKVPALVTPDLPAPLVESGAILSYIATKYDTAHLFSFPPTTPEHAYLTQWLYYISSTLYTNQITAYLLSFRTPAIPPKETIDFFRDQIKADWEYVEAQLKKEKAVHGGEVGWLVGGKYSVADIAAWAQLVCLDGMAKVEWKSWGLVEVERWAEAIQAREGVKKGFFALQESA